MADIMSKSAKKRAAKKARDEAHAVEEAKAAPAPAAAPAKKAEEPKPKEQPKAKAAAAAPPKAAEQGKPKAEAKKAAGKKKDVEAAPPPAPKKDTDPNYSIQVDDGSGDPWETAAGVSKRNQKRKEKKEEEERRVEQERIQALKDAKAEQKAGGGAKKKGNQEDDSKTAPVNTSGMSATQAAIAKAKELANAKVKPSAPAAQTSDKKDEEDEKTNNVSVTVKVPEDKIGRVIGPGGKNLKRIQEKTGIARIDTDQGVFTIIGEDASAVSQAEAAIKEMVEKGYMSLAYDDFHQIEVNAHPSSFPDLIGTRGAIIQAMKKALEVEITIPKVPPNAPASKKYPISVAGTKENTLKAKDCIESIINYYHHEITHEGLDHVEMDVEMDNYKYLIGRQGSEMRHIQKNWDVKVYIPRENSANQSVVIVGKKNDCEKAQQYMEKLIAGAGKEKGDNRKDKADDFWGDEEEEPWMKQYTYKRK